MKEKPKKLSVRGLERVNLNAAGIDIGSKENYVAIPEGRDTESVRKFGTFTRDNKKLCKWLKKNKIDTVAMESTGVYWIPLYEYLESKRLKVLLVNPRHIKNVQGRKTDVLDCQWLQQLHTYGLLNGAFRPIENMCILRSLLRQRKNLVRKMTKEVNQMGKALIQMNIKLHNVISTLTGDTGLKIIKAIVSGQKDPKKLAAFRDKRCRKSKEEIEKSLEGNYRTEHLFVLSQSLEAYEFYNEQLIACDKKIKEHLEFQDKEGGGSNQSMKNLLSGVVGVDLTKIEGISETTALTIISEVGLDMSKFPTVKHFASWLGLCTQESKSGGKILKNKTQKKPNRAAEALRIAASTLHKSESALGAFFRRIKSRRGAPKAITATAHKIARYIYAMLSKGEEYVSVKIEEYENNYREQVLKNLQRKARSFGYSLVPA